MFCGWGHMPDCRCEVCISLHNGTIARRRQRKRGKKKRKPWFWSLSVKRPKVNLAGRPIIPMEASDFSKEHPFIWEYLTAEFYSDDGTVRRTSTILIFTDGGSLKLCFNDRDNNRQFFHTAPTLELLLTETEVKLETDTAEWKSKTGRQSQDQTDRIPW
jgi:hypothetical protein